MICHAWEWGRTSVNSLSGGRQRDFMSNGNHISREISCLKRSKRRHQHSLIRVRYPPREHWGIQESREKDLECLWVNSYAFWESMGARCCSAAAWGRKHAENIGNSFTLFDILHTINVFSQSETRHFSDKKNLRILIHHHSFPPVRTDIW